tara:strand:+ start:2209 stop:2781 length:573 start_codon:yes stop_codon:yes gene_type:complete
MIKIGILGDIGSGKSFVAKSFGYPVFNADNEVVKIYKKSRICFLKLKKLLPKYIKTFPTDKSELTNAILSNKNNIKKITKIVHPLVRKKMNLFLLKNKNRKLVILDIPLLLENKIKNKNMILVFVDAKKSDISRRLSKRKGINSKILKRLKEIQLPLDYKKNKSQYIIKNYYTKKIVRKNVKTFLRKILK